MKIAMLQQADEDVETVGVKEITYPIYGISVRSALKENQ